MIHSSDLSCFKLTHFYEIKARLIKTGLENWWFRPPGFLQKISSTTKNPQPILCVPLDIKTTLSAKRAQLTLALAPTHFILLSATLLGGEGYGTFFTNCHMLADQWVNVSAFHLWKPQFNSLNYYGNKCSIVLVQYRLVFEEL